MGLTSLAHREPGVRLILQHTTRPACTLAGAERSDAVLPLSLFEVRSDTAWLALRIRLEALALADPRQGLGELRRLMRAGLRLADNLVISSIWASRSLARYALVKTGASRDVTGIGDLVDRWRLDPAALLSVNPAMRCSGFSDAS